MGEVCEARGAKIQHLGPRHRGRGHYLDLPATLKGGISIYDRAFPGDQTGETGLVAGGITGITNLIQEMTASKRNLEVIRQEGIMIRLFTGTHTTGALVAGEDLQILHEKLSGFVLECENLFKYEIPTWHGNLDVFAPARVVCERYF